MTLQEQIACPDGSAPKPSPALRHIGDWSHFADGRDATDIEADRAQVALYGGLCRVIEGAPVQNKLAVFGMMARTAAEEASAFRQQVIDDLWLVADGLGLVALVGVTSVQDVLATAFAGDAS
jgi:hypothetical protein